MRVLFGTDQAVLTSLGLLPNRSSVNGVEVASNGNDNGTGNGRHPSRSSASIAETIARRRLLLVNLQTLKVFKTFRVYSKARLKRAFFLSLGMIYWIK